MISVWRLIILAVLAMMVVEAFDVEVEVESDGDDDNEETIGGGSSTDKAKGHGYNPNPNGWDMDSLAKAGVTHLSNEVYD